MAFSQLARKKGEHDIYTRLLKATSARVFVPYEHPGIL